MGNHKLVLQNQTRLYKPEVSFAFNYLNFFCKSCREMESWYVYIIDTENVSI